MRSLLGLGIWIGALMAAPAAAEMQRERADPALNPFQKTYLAVDLARNYPAASTETRFDPGEWHPTLTYLHNLDADWLMALSGQFKILRHAGEPDSGVEENNRWLALWTMSHSALYAIRLNYPLYLLMGPKLLFMLPAKRAMLPLQRDPTFESEFGAALSVQLARIIDRRYLVFARIDRWRGTRTSRLQGIETAIGFSWAWD